MKQSLAFTIAGLRDLKKNELSILAKQASPEYEFRV